MHLLYHICSFSIILYRIFIVKSGRRALSLMAFVSNWMYVHIFRWATAFTTTSLYKCILPTNSILNCGGGKCPLGHVATNLLGFLGLWKVLLSERCELNVLSGVARRGSEIKGAVNGRKGERIKEDLKQFYSKDEIKAKFSFISFKEPVRSTMSPPGRFDSWPISLGALCLSHY